jgi:glycosyltransferase involved in cell wall biosynthesis
MIGNDTITKAPTVSIIVPARNEEANIAACLESLAIQTGVPFEIIVVDDHSTDRTQDIAGSFSPRYDNVRVIEAAPLPANCTGKNNAVSTGARAARGEWLLFTDADTVHLPGSLARAIAEAKQFNADMLSYSPEQIAITFWEMAILPIVFAELARQFPPTKVSDPNSSIAAANGQYILIRREAYDAIGGHAAVANEILEDVALARLVKQSGRKLRFRYAADAVRTRMYRNFAQLREGWTKNLALLFPDPGDLAAKMLLLWTVLWVGLLIPSIRLYWILVLAFTFAYLFQRINRANFPNSMTFRAVLFGIPMFAYLLLRSQRAHGKGSVAWKGRTYAGTSLEEKSQQLTTLPRTAGKLS